MIADWGPLMIFGIDVASMLLGGLAAGMVLFIVSVGLSVTMGLMGFVNLAPGGFAMLGGYLVQGFLRQSEIIIRLRWWTPWGGTVDYGTLTFIKPAIPFLPALLLAAVIIALFSIVLERLLYRRLYRANELDQVLFTIGLVFFMIA